MILFIYLFFIWCIKLIQKITRDNISLTHFNLTTVQPTVALLAAIKSNLWSAHVISVYSLSLENCGGVLGRSASAWRYKDFKILFLILIKIQNGYFTLGFLGLCDKILWYRIRDVWKAKRSWRIYFGNFLFSRKSNNIIVSSLLMRTVKILDSIFIIRDIL